MRHNARVTDATESPAPEQVLPDHPTVGASAPAGSVLPTAHHHHPTGRVVSVTVAAVSPNEVEVKLADGRTGVIARSDVAGDVNPTVGATLEAAVLARDDPRGRVVLSHSWATKLAAWDRVEAAMAAGETLTGVVARAIKGGLLVDLGVRAFLPTSMVEEHHAGGTPPDPATLVGTEVTVLVVEADRDDDRVVVSRRDVLRRDRRRAERDAYAQLRPGAVVRARVTAIVDYGAHVDVGGVRALLHRSEMSWAHGVRPADVVAVGDEIEVEVIEVNKSRRRVGVSLRRCQPDPFDGIEPGTVRTAVITRVVEYGAFAKLDDTDAVGLIHMTELSDLPGYRPDEVVAPGDPVHVKVLSLDPAKRRISLSITQALLS